MTSNADTVTVTLSHPIRVGETSISEVVVRRPKIRDLRALERSRQPDTSELDQGIAMAAALCDLAVDMVDEMDAEDFAAISGVVAGFLPRPPVTPDGEAS